MRFQATALMTAERKQLLEELAEAHDETQSRMLVAGLLALYGCSFEEQVLWLKAVDEKPE